MNDFKIQTHKVTAFNVANIEDLIRGQADVHKTDFTGNITIFKEDLSADQAKTGRKVPLIHGYFYTAGNQAQALAYTLFYPMFDKNGSFGFWGEDTFVQENMRERGIGTKMIKERVHAMFDAAQEVYRSYPPKFLNWVTAESNDAYHKVAKRVYGVEDSRNTLEVLDGSLILQNLSANNGFGSNFEAKKIDVRDAYLLEKMNANLQPDDMISPDFAAQSLHFPIIGFMVTRKGSDVPVAAMVTNARYSSFRTQWDLAAQPISFDKDLSQESKTQIMHSLFKAVQDFKTTATRDKILNCANADFTIMTKKDSDVSRILKEHFGMERLRLSNGDEKIAAPYNVPGDVLEKRFGHEFRFIMAS